MAEINAFYHPALPSAKIDYIFAVEGIPKQNNGKISRKQLLHELAKERVPSVI